MAGFHIDRGRALAAITAAAGRASGLIASIPDPNAPTTGLDWTVGQTAAHLVSSMRMHREWLRGEGEVDYGIPDLGRRNLQSLEGLGQKDPARLAALLHEHAGGYAREAAEQPAGATVPAEVGPPLTIEEITCVMLADRASPQWRRRGADEAQAVVTGLGLTGEFWRLAP
jgi:mycothiol maleylpyruvate isomerase-like protein